MLRIYCLVVAIVLWNSPCSSEEKTDPLENLTKKFHGHWYGQGPCDGELILRPDGSFEQRYFGPGGDNIKGTWKLDWKNLPPILNLHEADPADGVEPTSLWKVRELNAKRLVIQFVIDPKPGETRSAVYLRERRAK